jgi:hypothetical protein
MPVRNILFVMAVTISDTEIEKRTNTHKQRGFPFGVW